MDEVAELRIADVCFTLGCARFHVDDLSSAHVYLRLPMVNHWVFLH